jgi:hypothetical protein
MVELCINRYGDMIYDIYLLHFGSQPVAAVGEFAQKQEKDSYIQKEKEYTKQCRNTEYKTKVKKTRNQAQK